MQWCGYLAGKKGKTLNQRHGLYGNESCCRSPFLFSVQNKCQPTLSQPPRDNGHHTGSHRVSKGPLGIPGQIFSFCGCYSPLLEYTAYQMRRYITELICVCPTGRRHSQAFPPSPSKFPRSLQLPISSPILALKPARATTTFPPRPSRSQASHSSP